MDEARLRVLRVNPEDPNPLPLPRHASAGASGMDLAAAIEGELTLAPFERVAVPTGLRLEIPEGYEGQVRSRSGLSLREGLVCLNSPGTVDADYRGEVKVILANLSQKSVTIRRGERIAQLVICPVAKATVVEVDALSSTERGDGGFGSTGR